MKLNFVCSYPEKRNRPGFDDISPTLVIDASMERCPPPPAATPPPAFCVTVSFVYNYVYCIKWYFFTLVKISEWYHK